MPSRQSQLFSMRWSVTTATLKQHGFGGLLGGAISLLYALDDGIRAEDARQKRLEEGKPPADDFVARDL
jgi:hypothetical protein